MITRDTNPAVDGERRVGVEFAIEDSEMAGLDYAGPRVVGPGNYVLINAPVNPDWEPIPGGLPTLEIYVQASDLDEAQQVAESRYAEMRKEGGLPTQSNPRVVGLFGVSGEDPTWLQHFDEAEDMLDQKRYELAVVTAQIACEIEIRAAIEAVADAPDGSLARMAIDLPRSYSLIDNRAQAVFRTLFGKSPTSETFWEGYRDHVERRNNVLHRGARITKDDAVASVRVAEEMVDWVLKGKPS